MNVTESQFNAEEFSRQFSKNLLVYPEALDYLESRGIHQSLVEENLIGYNPPLSNYRAPLLKGRIVVGIRDVHDRIIGFAGRQFAPMAEPSKQALWDAFAYKPSTAEEMVKKWEHGKWVNEKFPKKRHLFNLSRAKDFARQSNFICVVEGYFDSFVFSSKFLPENGALCGAQISPMHVALISRYCEHVVMISDPDKAGVMGTQKSMPIIADGGLKPHSIVLPAPYDPDEFVIKYGGKQLRRIILGMIADNKEQVNINV